MPSVCRFYGIIIHMYFAETPHYLPHFHARYGEHEATFAINGKVLVGSLPPGKMKLVRAWAKMHRTELQSMWENLQNGEKSGKIEPLQ